MGQRYKLRLGDGTVLSVDQDGLRTWAADRRAMVQGVGSWRWQPLQEVLAEEEAAARLLRALVPPKPRQEATPPPPPTSPSPPLDQPAFSEPALGGLSFGEPAFSEPAVAAEARPGLQALADDPVSSAYADPRTAPASANDMPVIRMKPLDDEAVVPAAWSARRDADQDEDELAEDEPRHDRLDGPLLTVLETVGGFLSRCLDRLTPLAARLTSRASDASTPARIEETADRPPLFARISGWVGGLSARVRGSARAEPSEPAVLFQPPAASKSRPLIPRETLTAPTPVSELPTLPFAASRESRQAVDVYEGPDPWSALPTVWLWTRRVILTSALVAVLYFAVLERETWLPKTADLGQAVFTAIDRQVLSRRRTEERQRALADATARLPQLSPETIELIYSRSPSGLVEPPDVFEVAREAADRGLAALTKAEADELAALQGQLLAKLRSTERARVDEYDRTRARRLIFPFENPHVMELLARGARALPPSSRERLQTLHAKAVAAGLPLALGEGAPR